MRRIPPAILLLFLLTPGLTGAGEPFLGPSGDPEWSPSVPALQESAKAPADSIQLHATFDQALLDYNIPGAAIAAVKGGRIIWSTTHGFADPIEGIPVTDATSFMLASISKPFVAAALMQLVDDGLLDLDADVESYLPFVINNPYHPNEPITTRMLLAHVGSISSKNTTWQSMYTWGADSPVGLHEFLTRYLVVTGDLWAFDNFNTSVPGTEGMYSNVGYTLAAYLVETITGQSFEDYSQQNVFGPLGMSETSWLLSPLDQAQIAMPCTYVDGSYVAIGHYCFPTYPCGQLRMSLRQITKYLLLFLNHGELDGVRLLDSATTEQMVEIQYPGILIDGNKEWGLGWFRLYAGSGEYLWGHTGGLDGVATYLYFNPLTDYGFVVLTNIRSNAGHTVLVQGIWNYAKAWDPATAVSESPARQLARLGEAVPNPFNPRTTIGYHLTRSGSVELEIYDLAGRHVCTLVNASVTAGEHRVQWNGRNDAGEAVASGVYLYRLRAGEFAETRRVVLLK